MTGLVLKLSPGERFLVNGALLENGDKVARLRVIEAGVRVLRCRDAMRPEDVDTPVKQIYYGVQLVVSGDLEEGPTGPLIDRACADLLDIFEPVSPGLVPALRSMIRRRNYYSALCQLRDLMVLEAHVLRSGASVEPGVGLPGEATPVPLTPARKVA